MDNRRTSYDMSNAAIDRIREHVGAHPIGHHEVYHKVSFVFCFFLIFSFSYFFLVADQ